MSDIFEKPETGLMGGSPLGGRHAVVTGGTRGIGWEIARTLARLGANVTLMGRDGATLTRRVEELGELYGGACAAQTCDVGDAASVDAAFGAAVEANDAVDILINNAGIGASAPFHRMDDEHWRSIINTNLDGTFHCTRRVYPDMRAAGWGRIVNVASTAGLKGYGYIAAYAASKHGVVGLTRALAIEAAKTGVTVNAVCPGYTDTDIVAETVENIVAKTGRSAEEARAELAHHNPQGRLVQPWEVAETVAWLCLPASASITGLAIPVAGGEVT
jgi:NAD(P)-dependent dehydrogenase (short-subunit alcohol dehydrogenase family)